MQITVSSSSYNKIKQDIIFGHLQPGIKLKLNQLKLKYQTSISILREILNRLSSEGFVLIKNQKGFFVAPVSKEDLKEIADLRILLETNALKLSIETGDENWEANIVASHHKLKRMEQIILNDDTSKMKEWKKYDWEFHYSMIQSCNSQNLLDLHRIIYDKYLRYQMQVLTFRGIVATDEHKDMMEATLNRDFETAKNILTTHIELGLKHSMNAFDNV